MSRSPGFPSLRHEVDRLFDSLVHSAWSSRSGQQCWIPAADVTEEAGRYRIEMDLPGVEASDVSLTVTGRCLRVEGVRERTRQRSSGHHLLLERSTGRFTRNFQLPDDAAPDAMHANLDAGVLVVEIPKRQGGSHR